MRNSSMDNLPVVVWLTGLSGAGKTTLAKEVVKKFKEKNGEI